ncbi:hypothetical protein CLOSBL3_10616 [Clostridiaceae bacterium BL-3]|nr:hypothetical protein CLOSBL3_10616 [Clostridiaceae bacterium BL-3]
MTKKPSTSISGGSSQTNNEDSGYIVIDNNTSSAFVSEFGYEQILINLLKYTFLT